MSGFVDSSAFFGVAISLLTYQVGAILYKKTRFPLFNPLLIAIALTMALLAVFKIPYSSYQAGGKYLSYLLTPATICLALPLYEKLSMLKQNAKAILLGILTGVVVTMISILALGALLRISHTAYVTLLPKSITTAIGMGVSEELGGNVTLTVVSIIITGLIGNITAPMLCKLFGIVDPIAKGIAIGSASHAVGTARAMEIGETEGAMSSLSIVVSGLLTVVAAPLFAQLL